MTAQQIFVGRKAELEQFRKVLEDPRGQAVLVVGQAGMGKTWLVNEAMLRAEKGVLGQARCAFRCWSVRYEIAPTDDVNDLMGEIVSDARLAAHPVLRKLGVSRSSEQKWRALLSAGGLLPVLGGKIKALGDLLLSLGEQQTGMRRDTLMQALAGLSAFMADEGRAVFIIDPEKVMPPRSDHAWRLVVQRLPKFVKLVFPQRPNDVLFTSREFCALPNVVRVPESELHVLQREDLVDLVHSYSARTGVGEGQLSEAINRYNGHPYGAHAALRLVENRVQLSELPSDPGQIAGAQWDEVRKYGADAIRLFKAYAILESAVPDRLVASVADLEADSMESLLANDFLGALLRSERGGRRIYHSILSDCILELMSAEESVAYHERAIATYRASLRFLEYPETRKLLSHFTGANRRVSVVVYNSLIHKSPDYETAKGWLEEMRARGISPNVWTYNTLVDVAPDHEAAEDWLKDMQAEGIPSNVITYNTLVKRAPDYEAARALMEAMQARGIAPNARTYNTLVNRAPDYDEARAWMEAMQANGIAPNVTTYNTLVTRAPDYETAMAWLAKMDAKGIVRDVATYNILIMRAPDYERAKDWLEEMEVKGIAPNVTTYNALITRAPDYEAAKGWLEVLQTRGIMANARTYNTLVNRAPSYEAATSWFKEMLAKGIVPNVNTYSSLMDRAPNYDAATDWFKEMLAKGIVPNVSTYSSLMNRAPNYEAAADWFKEMLARGIMANVRTYTKLIFRAPNDKVAMGWLEEMLARGIVPNVRMYNNLIFHAPNHKVAMGWMDEMLAKGIVPNVRTYNRLIYHAPDYETAKGWLEKMAAEGISPTVATYDVLVKHAPEHDIAKLLQRWPYLRKGRA